MTLVVYVMAITLVMVGSVLAVGFFVRRYVRYRDSRLVT
jgi:hypothetical protein